MSADGWEWAKYRAKRAEEIREFQTRTRKTAESEIEWQLPAELLPLRTRKIDRPWPDKPALYWYTASSKRPVSFVYLLLEQTSGAVRYVGLTDDPPRRHQEHRRAKKLDGAFRMVVVAIGGEETEKEWIRKCITEGCKLLNIASTL